MARIGFQRAKSKADKVADRADVIVNKQGGIGYAITDPTQRLMAATAYLGEPGFFPEKGVNDASGLDYHADVLDDRGREIYDTAVEVLRGSHPEDVLIIAHWARQKLNMRLFPQILMVAAARHLKVENVENPIIRYMPKISHRPDDLLQVHALYNALFGKATGAGTYRKAVLPSRLKRAMARTFGGYDVYKLVKYNRPQNHPNYADLLGSLRGGRLVPKSAMRVGKKHNGEAPSWPLSKALRDYLIDGKMSDELPTRIKARHDFMALPAEASLAEIRAHAKAAGLTWEDVVSKFGGKNVDEKRKAAVWSAAAEQMGAMALFKNLRNLLQAGVPNLAKRTAKVYTPEFVRSSRLLPWRFYNAYTALSQAAGVGDVERKRVQENVSKALDVAASENVPEFPGVTAIFVDVSGSMNTKISAKSVTSAAEAACLMAGILNRRCETALVYAFASTVSEIHTTKSDPVLSVVSKIKKASVGYSTNFHMSFETLRKRRIKADRIVFLTDNEASSRFNSCGREAERYASQHPDVFIHAIDLQAHGQSAVHTSMKRYNLVSGFSESIFTTLAQFEARYGNTETGKGRTLTAIEENVLPTIESLRDQFTVAPAQSESPVAAG